MTTYPEPPDGSHVGWGTRSTDLRWIYQRADDIARDTGNEDSQRWYLCDDYSGMGDNPASWAEIARHRKGLIPYLLTPTPLTSED